MTTVKALFVKQFGVQLKKPSTTAISAQEFNSTFDALVRKLDTGNNGNRSEQDSEDPVELTPPSSAASATEEGHDEPPPLPGFKKLPNHLRPSEETTSTEATPVPTPETSRPATPASSHLLTAKAAVGKTSRRAKKAAGTSAPVSSGDEDVGRRTAKGGKGQKSRRRWDADGIAVDDDEDVVLDYSAPTSHPAETDTSATQVKADDMGHRTGKGQFVLKDLDDEVDAILASAAHQKQKTEVQTDTGILGSASNRLTGLFRNVVGGKTLTKEELRAPLLQMESHLVEKNVAREAAVRLCESVETDLLNQKTVTFTSIDKTIRESMAKALTRILTPTSSLDLLRSITTTIEPPDARPYVISIVGVNGVGKSTSLSKIAYFLLQNKFRVLIVAGDTFRSGAVEQLKVHVRNLSGLSRRENAGKVELFEKGYGKDAAQVARDAVNFASGDGSGILFDVVLVDTAGRRHNDTRLMSSLTKFGQLANPDKIFMVGEALVGSDSVAQARNFAKEFVDTKVCRSAFVLDEANALIGPDEEQWRGHGWLYHIEV